MQAAKKKKLSEAAEEYTVRIRDGGVADGTHIVIKLATRPATCAEIVDRFLDQRKPPESPAAGPEPEAVAAAAPTGNWRLQAQLPVLMLDCERGTQPWCAIASVTSCCNAAAVNCRLRQFVTMVKNGKSE